MSVLLFSAFLSRYQFLRKNIDLSHFETSPCCTSTLDYICSLNISVPYLVVSVELVAFYSITGNSKKHIAALKKAVDMNCSGEPSLYNSLNLAMQTLKLVYT